MKIKTIIWRILLVICSAFLACLSETGTAQTEAPTNATAAVLQQSVFRERLIWIGKEPSDKESTQVLEILRNLDQPTWRMQVETFLQDHPESPWAASLHQAYASFCHGTGRTTKALEHWEAGWNLVKEDLSINGRRLAGDILASWMEQLSSLGRRDKLRKLITAGDRLSFASRQNREKFQSAKKNYYVMGKYPELSFRCGTLALKSVGQVLQPDNPQFQSLVDVSSPVNGFSLGGLADLAKQCGLDLVAARRTRGSDLIVPSVVHWRQNHYAAIVDKNGANYLINDPTFGKPKWMEAEAINEETSGVFLVPISGLKSNWQSLDAAEMAAIRGKGLPNNILDTKDKGCITSVGGAKKCPCTGMPVWWVSEPYINLWIADEPISYLTSTGEPFTFRINFKQRGVSSYYGEVPGAFVTNGTFNPWTHSWYSYIALETTTIGGQFPTLANSDATLYLPNGGEATFTPGKNYDPETRLLLQQVDPNVSLSTEWGAKSTSADNGDNGLRVVHADGSQDIYGNGVLKYLPPSFYSSKVVYMLSRHVDPHGRTTQFLYGTNQLVQYVVDPDGLTNTLSYTFYNSNGIAGYLLAQVANPYGSSAHFYYDGNLNLTNIVDAFGLSSALTYDTNGDPASLVTPYGTNTFALYENMAVTSTNDAEGNFGGDDLVDRAARVTDPLGGNHLFLYRYDCSQFMPTNYPAGDVPTNTPLGKLDTGAGGTNFLTATCYRNSFSWNARQSAALSTNNFLSFNSNDFIRGAMKHWLEDTNYLSLTGCLSVERDASPDGSTEGLKTFYDYQGKIYPQRAGTNFLPSVTAWRIPGSETHYEYVRYDYFGNVTNRTTTYTTSVGTTGTRAHSYLYADNIFTNVFYYQYSSPSNFFLPGRSNTFTVPNLLIAEINSYGSNVWTYGSFDAVAWTNFFKIDSVGDTNLIVLSSRRMLPSMATNGLGQRTGLTFTGFNKVNSIKWPSGLTTTNVYTTNGFLVQTRDLESNRTNSFAYTTNGLISTYTNELGLVVGLYWDNLLRLTGVSFPDNTTISNVYTALDVTSQKDRLNHWTYLAYDGLRHLSTLTTTNTGNVTNTTTLSWCGCGALTGIIDALTNITTLNYDNQGRLTNVVLADLASITYQYDLLGQRTNILDGTNFTSLLYNNQGLVTNASNTYGPLLKVIYDALDRPTQITDANNVTLTNGYDLLDRLVTRAWPDGVTEGLVYATNGLITYTNRDQKVTHFGRDLAGRLTFITNANQEVVQLGYDAASHVTSLIDGLTHTTTWGYNPFGWVTSKADNSGHDTFRFFYDANGQLTNRWTPGTTNTTYAYDALGNLTNISYPGAVNPTASVSYAYDVLNRLTNLIDAVGTTAFTYTPTGQLATESNPFTSLSGTLTYLYKQGHRTNLSLSQPSGTAAWNQAYTYDSAWRLQSLVSSAGAFGYGYTGASGLVQSLNLPNGAGITNHYDSLARLDYTGLSNHWGHILDGYRYTYGRADFGTGIGRDFGLTSNNVTIGYDNIGQLTSWAAQETNGTLRHNEQLSYGYDAADNLHLRTNDALVQTFNVDAFNELTNVSRTGTFTLTGATPAPATNVTVNGVAAQRYTDFTFARTNLSLVDGSNTFTTVATNVYNTASTNSLTINLPANVTLHYDTNGNLIGNGTQTLLYDAENQLTNVYVTNQWKSEFIYDGFGRQRITRDYSWSGSAWARTNEIRLEYDGMLPIQERSSNNAVLVTYTRGLDLSGSRQGAGGIGGMLARTDTNGNAYYHADGSGNITALIDAYQNIVARYEYDGFGRHINKSGRMAEVNHYRFSSKEIHSLSGLYSYGFRFYDPSFQRWINRDPIGEAGGINLHEFVGNDPLNQIDPLGLRGASEEELDPEGEITRELLAELRLGLRSRYENGRYVTDSEFEARERMFEENTKERNEKFEPLEPYNGKEPIMRALIPKGQCPPRGGVYGLRDPLTLQIMRTGRTKDFKSREQDHARNYLFRDFKFERFYPTDNRSEQRGLEQMVHESFKPPFNKINGISINNPNRADYMKAASQFLNDNK